MTKHFIDITERMLQAKQLRDLIADLDNWPCDPESIWRCMSRDEADALREILTSELNVIMDDIKGHAKMALHGL